MPSPWCFACTPSSVRCWAADVAAKKKAVKKAGKEGEIGKDSVENRVEIYALLDPRDSAIRYIGKANNTLKRFKGHLSETRRQTPVYCWIGTLRELGLVPAFQVLSVCTRANWQQCEREAIASARLGGANILNLANGGNEPYCAPEIRAANGRKSAVARVSTPRKAKIYEAKQALGILLRQGFVRESTKEKLRALALSYPNQFCAWAYL